jgi:hypothetical protein
MIVGLVACCGPKLKKAAQAADLYKSDLFRKSVSYLAHLGVDHWAILSAKHGLVMPTQAIAPYDMTLAKMSAAERRAWADRVRGQLQIAFPPGAHFVVLAGKHYLAALHGSGPGFTYEDPLKGMQIGERLRFLKEAVE